MTSWQKPTANQISRVRLQALRPEEERYFFARLENPLWIDALRDAGCLEAPPPVTVEEGTRYPHWPISQYIARVAGEHPDHAFIGDVLARLAPTENLAVRRDLVEAMMALEPRVLTNLLPLVAGWVGEPGSGFWAWGHVVGGIAAHALRHAENAAPVEAILRAYLQPQWDDVGEWPRASLRIQSWDVTEFADGFVEALVETGGTLLLSVVLGHLASVLDRKFTEPRLVNGFKQDYSSTWRWDLTSKEGLSQADDLLAYLASRSVDELAPSTSQDAKAVVQLLDDGGWVIHQRLALRFLSQWSGDEDVRDETYSRLANPELARAHHLRREYDELLGAAFAEAGEQDRAAILSGLEAAAAPQSDDSDRWLYERLAVISDHLTGDWAERFKGYAEQFDAPREPVPPLSISWESSTARSPLGAGDAETMTVSDLAAYACDWSLPEDEEPWKRPNWRGLAEDIKAQARARPSEFSVAAELFADVNPTVVAALLSGLEDAVRDNDSIDWRSTLGVIKAIAPKYENRQENEDFGVEQDSSWWAAKSQALDLLEAGLGSDESPSSELAPLLWETLELLAAHGTAPDHVVLDGPRDSVFAALNATRSRAVYTVVVYLWWLGRHGIESVPDGVAGFFRRILDPEAESFIGMRAAVAHRLPQLAHVDADWTAGLLPDVFADRAAWPEHWDAAWDAYVRHATPLPPEPILEAMEGYYASAVKLIDLGHEVGSDGDPVVHLGIHLVLMYLHGMLELDHPNLVAFFDRAPAAVRPRILDWIGRTAAQDDLPDEWFVRAREFFEWREQRVAADGLAGTELRKLGWFVASGAFPEQWWAPRLADVLRATTDESYDGFVPLDDMMQRVAAASEDDPEMALQVLDVVVDQNERGWHRRYLDAARVIVTRAVEVPMLRFRARQVADRLARDGHDEFEQFSVD